MFILKKLVQVDFQHLWSFCWSTNLVATKFGNDITWFLSHLMPLFSLHEEATKLLEWRAFCGWGLGGARLRPGFPESRTAATEEAQGGVGPWGEGGSEKSLPTEALSLPQNHWRAGLPAQSEDQYCHQLVSQLQVSIYQVCSLANFVFSTK